MQEAERQKCLQWMGVKPLQARYPFACAEPSFAFYQHVEEKTQPVSVPSSQSKALSAFDEAPKKAADTLSALMKSDDIPAKVKQTLHVETPSLQKQPVVKNDKKFRLRYVQMGCVLFLQNQPTLQWQNASAELIFMRDIATAVMGKAPESKITDQFTWPPSAYFADSPDLMIQETLTPFLTNILSDESEGRPLVIKFGLDQHPYLGNFIDTALTGVLRVDVQQVADYFREPALKPALWQSLKAVI